MPEPTTSPILINDQLVEIRYRANAAILDYRGTWAEKLTNQLTLTDWQVIENRFDVFDKGDLRHGFASFKNAGFKVRNTPTKNYFPDQANHFFRFLLEQKAFGDSLFCSRIGVKSRFAIKYDGDFEKLLKLFTNKLFVIDPSVKRLFQADISDVGFHFDLATPSGKINSWIGPMLKEQFKEFFELEQEYPEVGVYFDLDYSQNRQDKITGRELLGIIRQFSDQNWERYQTITELLAGQ